jgi:hypothetical protein
MSGNIGNQNSSKTALLAGVCTAALAIACSFDSPASAATYLVSNDTELRNAITTANGDGDASATIVLTSSFSWQIQPCRLQASQSPSIRKALHSRVPITRQQWALGVQFTSRVLFHLAPRSRSPACWLAVAPVLRARHLDRLGSGSSNRQRPSTTERLLVERAAERAEPEGPVSGFSQIRR